MVSLAEMQAAARARGGECLATADAALSHSVLWRCVDGHEWEASPSRVIKRGSWCARCYHNSRIKHATPEAKKAAGAVASLASYHRNKEEASRRHKNWRDSNPDIVKNMQLKTEYGITLAEYEGMLERQGGVCSICGGPPVLNKNFCVDHDHVTGAVRGLLCRRCNSGLGMFKDSLELLERAVRYMRSCEADDGNPET